MKYFYIAPEKQQNDIFQKGIHANESGNITLVVLKDDFLMKKFVFDMYAYEELKLDVYCLFEIAEEGVEGPLFDSQINSLFSDSYKNSKQIHIQPQYLSNYKTDENYQGMGLEKGVFPVEYKDKFTDTYKRKVLEYLEEVVC